MEAYAKIKEELNKTIDVAKQHKTQIKMCIIASVKDKTKKCADYSEHSVSTSYLTMADVDELLGYFQEFGIYTTVYFDIEDYIKNYYSCDEKERPNLIFETSPKGIGRGKDALIPCLCDIWGVKHLGPTANVNCLCSSKYQWGAILASHNIATPKSCFYVNGTWVSTPQIGVKYLMKLNYECASIGLSDKSVIVNDGNNVSDYANGLFCKYSQAVIAQEFIDGYEVEVPVLVNSNRTIVLPPVGLSFNNKELLGSEFLNYDTIYNDRYGFYDFAKVKPQTASEIRNCVEKITSILDLNGYMRIDFRVKPNGEFFVIDINNDPTLDINGSFMQSLSFLGYDYSTIAPLIIGNCME